MLIGVIQVIELEKTLAQIAAVTALVDALELRLDYQPFFNMIEIAHIRHACQLPIIFTLRKKSQGGYYQQSEESRLAHLIELCTLAPDYIDLEFDIPQEAMREIHSNFPHIKIICSYHDFEKTPLDLHLILEKMLNPWCKIYKIATFANTTQDALRMMKFIADTKQALDKAYQVSGLCMGKFGSCTRILGPVFANELNYANIDEDQETSPGQITINELLTSYRYRKLNQQTKIYALLGDPVEKSVGHILHNEAIEILNGNAIYIKLQISIERLKGTFALLRELPFMGFSITMPLKEKIVDLIDELDEETKKIKAINTIYYYNQKMVGCNTDGEGATLALLQKINLTEKRVVILGAGGAAKAIAFAAKKAGAHIILCNRTLTKARAITDQLTGEAFDLSDGKQLKQLDYHVLINTIPSAAFESNLLQTWLASDIFLSGAIVMDIVYHTRMTKFLQVAATKGCVCIPGYEMYIQQALLQVKYWFAPKTIKLQQIQNRMQNFFTAKKQFY